MSRLRAMAVLAATAGVLLRADHRHSPRPEVAHEGVASHQPPRSVKRLASLLARARAAPRFVRATPSRPFPGFPPDVLTTDAGALYAIEPRDSLWAPAMESAVAQRFFAADVLAPLGLAELKVLSVSCRQTTCRMEYEFPSRLTAAVAEAGLRPSSPMVLVEEAVGWPAPRGGGLQKETFRRGGQAFTRMSVFLGFDERSWDPATYGDWVTDQLPAARDFYRRAREDWQRHQADTTFEPREQDYGDAG
jgi:hypothetical protein